ncbi:MAG TPA: SDR family oxidoreductase [Ktedonobacterales bacterium]
MRIVVLGGSGLIGSKLVTLLRQGGQDVVSASHTSGLDTTTGEGLDAALAGAQVVVDVTNSPSFEDKAVMNFFESSGRHIVAAEKKAGVTHHVALSVVGTDRLQESGYFRAKLAQEHLIEESPIPYTILRATQFFEFLGAIAQEGTVGQTVHVSSALFQPIAANDVAATLATIAVNPPVNGIVEVAGPERISLAELVQRFLRETGDARQVVADSHARYYGLVLNDQSLTPGAHPRLGSTTFDGWISTSKLKA